ncbi:MAG TPA: methyltransferase domain-containing protein [Streptosporangiaceae bacterium]|jgi:ubiquinone/menaquinone biosynthesis C-methylase UbiE|nr:methyltransferase domain-containing protein [Streptosporangiaceae bacterium]
MVPADGRSGPAGFEAVDASGDPAALIGLLEAARTVPGLVAAKRGLLEQLALGTAQAALDVGCGYGADVADMARRMPRGTQVSGVDASEAMIAEARRRTASFGARVSLRVGEATDLPYPDHMFDACRADTVLQHVPDPGRVVSEMARVTRPGGRVAVLEFDQGTAFLDHPDTETTRIILDTFTDAAVHGWIGRQVPRLFRLAGLTDVSVTPLVILSNAPFWRILYQSQVARLQDQGLLTDEETSLWWVELEEWAQEGNFLGGATVFVVAASRPS